MSPEMQKLLEQKQSRRRRLAALPYPEKIRIVVQMRDACLRIKASTAETRGAGGKRQWIPDPVENVRADVG